MSSSRLRSPWMWAFVTFSAATTLLIAAMCISLFWPQTVSWRRLGIALCKGEVAIGLGSAPIQCEWSGAVNRPTWELSRGSTVVLDGPRGWRPHAASAQVVMGTTRIQLQALWAPLWIPLVVGGCAALYSGRRAMRGRRRGHCESCDYDLAGTPGEVCPECGTAGAVFGGS